MNNSMPVWVFFFIEFSKKGGYLPLLGYDNGLLQGVSVRNQPFPLSPLLSMVRPRYRERQLEENFKTCYFLPFL